MDAAEYYFDYDQRQRSNLALEYRTPQARKWLPQVVGLNFRFYTGRPYTPTIGYYSDENGSHLVKGETNSKRYGDFHALSLRLEWQFPVFTKAQGKFYLEGWNLYNRKNQMGVDYKLGAQYPNGVKERPYYSTPLLIGGGVGISF